MGRPDASAQATTGEFDAISEIRSLESSVRELRSVFIEGTRSRLDDLEVALARMVASEPGDGRALGDVRSQFQAIAASGSTYGFPTVSTIARRAEEQCEAVLAGPAAARDRCVRWARALAELRSALEDRPAPVPPTTPVAPRSLVTRLVLGADPRVFRFPLPPGALAGCTVDEAETPEQLSDLLDGAPKDGIVLVPGLAFGDAHAVLRAIRSHPHGERVPVIVLLDELSLVERIELIQIGATRILPRATPWDGIANVVTLVQPLREIERGTVFILDHDEVLARRIAADLDHHHIAVKSYRDLPAMFAGWQEHAADLLIVGRDATLAPNWPVLASLRKRERLKSLPVFVLVDRIDEEGRRVAFQRGADDYLLLPYVREELIARVEVRLALRGATHRLHLLSSRARARPPRPTPPADAVAPSGAPRRVRVLLADDDRIVSRVMESRLSAEGWDVVLAADGEQAERLIEGGGFDLVMLDLNMPFRSGFDLLQWMSKRGLKRHSRVIILSAQNREEAILRAFSLEADDFIAKPFNLEVVVMRLRRLLKR